MRINDYFPYLILFSILLADCIIFGGLIHMFFNGDPTIIAGIIAFIGAIIGGLITYVGVNRTLEHRDREIFLSEATEKLMNMELFIDKYSNYLNAAFLYEQMIGESPRNGQVFELISSTFKRVVSDLKEDKEKMYRSMEYDAIEILNFHQKSIELSIRSKSFSEKEAHNCIGKIRDVFQVFEVSKKQLELKYRHYKNKR